jgi:F0F1-type ATP synthase membrane subunit c/vacuolar-type H+-ATPase subunit K
MLATIVTYLLIAFILEVVDRFTDPPLFVRRPSKHFPWRLNISTGWWGVREYWAAITLGSISALMLMMLWVGLGSPVSKDLGRVLLVVLCVSSSVLSILHFRLVEKFKANAWWMTVLTALITIGFGLVASAYADSFIVNSTRIDAAQFSGAQKALTTVILVYLWAFFATLLISLIVFAVSLYMAFTTPTFFDAIKSNPLTAPFRKRYKPGLEHTRRSWMLGIVFVGSIYTVFIALTCWEYLLSHVDSVIEETIVFASFHLHPRDCGIPGRGQDERAALVSEGRAVIATPFGKGYRFATLACHMQSSEAVDKAILDRLKLDHYF